VIALPTSTTNITGFLMVWRGSNFMNDCLIADFMILSLSAFVKGASSPLLLLWADFASRFCRWLIELSRLRFQG